ncbi:MAG: type III-A CRISPR-associated RAMP protein Csm4 [Candidatus Hydrogenedentales bacterium]|jgi:CRISPR-associated protein Csm4
MEIYRVHIRPRAPFFNGPHSRAPKTGALVHSDTLHAALVSVAAMHGSPLLKRAETLRVSSLYPSWGGVCFLPKPFLRPPGEEGASNPLERKRWKTIRLVSEGMLTAWLAGALEESQLASEAPAGCALLQDELPTGAPVPRALMAEEISAAVAVDRHGAGTMPFDRRGLRVNTGEGCGAYFLAELEDAESGPFRALADHLGEQGLGGERSVGYGRFEVASCEPVGGTLFATHGAADAFLTLSLYLPTEEEVAAGALEAPAAYDCTVRGGWIHSAGGTTQRKRSLRMCVEGGVFKKISGRHGDVRNTAPASFTRHPVYRSGLAFELPFQFKEGIHS